jgi:hypothetical protein
MHPTLVEAIVRQRNAGHMAAAARLRALREVRAVRRAELINRLAPPEPTKSRVLSASMSR